MEKNMDKIKVKKLQEYINKRIDKILNEEKLTESSSEGFYPFLIGTCQGTIKTLMYTNNLPKNVAKNLAKSFEEAIEKYNPGDISKKSTQEFIDELKKYIGDIK